MDGTNYIQSSSWSTDDKRFVFGFKSNFNKNTNQIRVKVSLNFVSPSSSQKLLWDNVELKINDKDLVFFEDTITGYCIKGSLKAFTEISNKSSRLIIWGDIQHGPMDNLFHFTGPMAIESVYTPSLPHPPVVPMPVVPEEKAEAGIVSSPIIPDSYNDMFPFIYLSNWPDLEDPGKNFSFVVYTPVITSPPANSFYHKLAGLKKTGDRNKMEEEAERFVKNQDPYKGLFIPEVKDLTGEIAQFPRVQKELERMEDCNSILFNICRLLSANIEDIYLYLKSPGYILQKEKIWQTYFALVIKTGHRPKWLDKMTRILTTCNLFEELFFNTTEDIGKVPFSPEEIKELIHATIILPENIFPLPPFLCSPPVKGSGSWVKFYAIGRLQLVKQKFLRYEAGEIADIISVMPGEKKENTKRKLHQESDRNQSSELSENINGQDTRERNLDLTSEAIKTLAHSKDTFTYTDYSTNYGAPTSMTLNGSYSTEKEGIDPENRKASIFAKKIISQTSANIRKQVGIQRIRLVNHEQEDTSVSILDNTGNKNAIYGTYYWLNKVYEAQLANYGNRLMLSFFITSPSCQYIKAEFNYKNEKLVEPKSPATLFQISSFNDITLDNYLQVCSYYHVENFELPPDENQIVSGILEGNESKFIEIPEGYEANMAYVTYISNQQEEQWTVNGLVGRQEFHFTGTTGIFTPLTLSKEDRSIPVSATCSFPFLSPPTQVRNFRINIEIDCNCSNRTMNEWKKKIYHQIVLKYENQRVAYFNELNSNSNFSKNSNPFYQRKTIKKEFKKSCIKQLINNMMEIKGLSINPAQIPLSDFDSGKTGILNFLEHAIEWNEMTYCLLEDFGDDLDYSDMENISQGDENIFKAFLQAEGAKIIVPVNPEFNYSLIFFMTTGLVWPGADKLVPSIANHVSLTYALKRLKYLHPKEQKSPEKWEFKVPTSLQFLSNKLELNLEQQEE